MTLHREGRNLIFSALAFWLAVVAAILLLEPAAYISWPLGFIATALLITVLQFFRMPTKNTVRNARHIIAPADGKVVVIEETEDAEFNEVSKAGRRIQVSIFMSPINVHSNHNPVSGVLKFFKYHPGKFLVAWHPKSSTENERTTLVYALPNGQEILVRQIAGALAKRIRWYVKQGQPVQQGDEFGFIKFGSRVDLYLPLGTEINVKLGDVTTGAETVIATLPA